MQFLEETVDGDNIKSKKVKGLYECYKIHVEIFLPVMTTSTELWLKVYAAIGKFFKIPLHGDYEKLRLTII